jgi:hypothetical protein
MLLVMMRIQEQYQVVDMDELNSLKHVALMY